MTARAGKPEQLPLEFRHEAASGRDDLVISDPVSAAAAIIDRWPDWPSPVVIITGPEGSGKSHLAEVWVRQSGAVRVAPVKGSDAVLRAGQGPEVVGETQTGVFAVDGKRLIAINGSVIKGRRRQIEQGSAVVTIVLDHKGRVMAPPQVTATGLLSSDQDQAALEKVVDDVALELDEMTGAELRSDVEVRESVRLAARRSLFKLTGKKPAIDVHLVRVS